MGVTATATRLTQAHRVDQTQLANRFTVAFVELFHALLNPRRVDDSAPVWVATAEQLVATYARSSALLASGYYDDHRATELDTLGISGTSATASDDVRQAAGSRDVVLPEPAAVRTSLMVCGPAVVKHASATGTPITEAAETAAARSAAAASRHVLSGGRNEIVRRVAADEAALGYARVTGPFPCWLCAMQASRGPTFTTKSSAVTAREKTAEYAAFLRDTDDGSGSFTGAKYTGRRAVYHDGCRCTAEPVYSASAPWPGPAREFEALWRDVARGLPAAEARKAFRRAIDARNTRPAAVDPGPDVPPEPDRNTRDQVPEPAPEASGTTGQVPPEPSDPAPEPPAEPAASGRALAGVDLAALSDDDVFALFADSGDDVVALEALTAELDRRDNEPDTDTAETDPLADINLEGLGPAWLDRLAADHADRPEVVERLDAERDRRAARQQPAPEPAPMEPEPLDDLTPGQERVNDLVAQGWDWQEAYAEAYALDADMLDRQARNAEVDAHRQAGETREETVRRLYREHVDVQYNAAETATRGHLLTRDAAAVGIDARDLFSGPTARARRYASEDLQRWWAEHGRTTFTEFRAALLGRESDKRAAKVTAMQGNGRDFI